MLYKERPSPYRPPGVVAESVPRRAWACICGHTGAASLAMIPGQGADDTDES